MPRVWSQRPGELLLFATVLLVATALRAKFWALALPPGLVRDSGSYVLTAFDLVNRGEYVADPRHPAGYGLFIAAVLSASGADGLAPLLAIQHALGVLTAGFCYLLGRVVVDRSTGLIAGLLVALDGALLLFEHTVSPEAPSAFCLASSTVLIVLALRSGRSRLVFWSGVALGLLAVSRPTGLPMILPALIGCLAMLRRRWLGAGALVAGVLLPLVPATIFNYLHHGTPSLVRSIRAPIHRAIHDDDIFVRMEAYEQSTENDPLKKAALEILAEEDAERDPDPVAFRLRQELDLSDEQAEVLMRDLLIQAILFDPVHYASTSLRVAVQLVNNTPLELSGFWLDYEDLRWRSRIKTLLPEQDRHNWPAAQLSVSLVDPGRFGVVAGALFLTGLVACCRQREYSVWLVPATMLGIGIGMTAGLAGVDWRHRFGLDPLLLTGAAIGSVYLVRASTQVARGRRPGRRVRDESSRRLSPRQFDC